MFGKKFEEFISQQSTKIGMTTIERIPDNALRESRTTQPARSSSSSEASVDSGFLQHPSAEEAARVSTEAAKMFAFAKTLEFMRSAHMLSNIRDDEGEEFREVCDEMDEETKTDDVKKEITNPANMFGKKFEEFVGQQSTKIGMTTVERIPDNYAESGIGSEMKSEASSDSEEEVIICETDEEELALTGKRLVSSVEKAFSSLCSRP